MAYAFGAANTDSIDCGPNVTKNTKYTLYARFTTTVINTATRMLAAYYVDASVQYQTALYFGGASNMIANGLFSWTSGTTNYVGTTWLSGFGAGETHRLTYAVDPGSTLQDLYADSDSTAKAHVGDAHAADQVANQRFTIGNNQGQTNSFNGTIYEIAWWAGTLLTGGQIAQLASGNLSGIPNPTSYWGFNVDATDLFGGQHGTVTGAVLAAGDGLNLYNNPTRSQGRGLLLGVS